MNKESLKQREQRIAYQKSMGIRTEGLMHDRFANEECDVCGSNPCSCKTEKDKSAPSLGKVAEDTLREIRGGM